MPLNLKMARLVTLLLIIKFDVAVASSPFSDGQSWGCFCVCWVWVGGASLGGCSLTQVLCEQMSVHSRQAAGDRLMKQLHPGP